MTTIEKIRAEILNFKEKCNASDYLGCGILEIIDKYAEQEPCDDVVSREAVIDKVIDAVDEWDGGCNKSRATLIEKAVRDLPSVRPQEPQESDEISERNMKMWQDIFEEEKRRAE